VMEKVSGNVWTSVRIGWAIAASACLMRAAILADVGGGIETLLQPFAAFVLAWVLAPIVFVAWCVRWSAFWLATLITIAILGGGFVYQFAYDTSSSTAALAWLFYPIYEWGFIILSAIVIGVARWVGNEH